MRDRWPDFAAATDSRLKQGAREYGDRSFDLASTSLLDEIREELEDVAGWAFILWVRLGRVRDVLTVTGPSKAAGHARRRGAPLKRI